MTGFEILHKSRASAALGSRHVVAFRHRKHDGMDAYWMILTRSRPTSQLGRGKTLRAALHAAGINRTIFKQGGA